MEITINNILENGEKILWQGKPNYKRHMRTMYYWTLYIATLLLPSFSLPFLAASYNVFLIALVITAVIVIVICVWMITAAKKANGNQLYVFTDKRIVIQSGTYAITYKSVEYSMIFDISVRVGVIDRKYNTGVIMLMGNARQISSLTFMDNPYEVFKTIKKICEEHRVDVYTKTTD